MGIHRVELQLNRKFLVRHGINGTSDFRRLVKILPVHHIFFAELDETKVRHHLRCAGHSAHAVNRIMERVRDCEGDLHAQCSVLRKAGRLINVRRVLIPLRQNDLVLRALKKWAAQWSRNGRRLEERK
jgi:hypothetical protein